MNAEEEVHGQLSLFNIYRSLSLKHFFRVYMASSKQEEGWEEIETVMQTWDVVEGLHNFGEFSQPSEC